MLAEFQRRSVFRQRSEIHLEKVGGEFSVKVMEFVFVLAVFFLQISRVRFFKIIQIVWAFRIHTFVNSKVLSIFLADKSMLAIRTLQWEFLGEPICFRRKERIADFAF